MKVIRRVLSSLLILVAMSGCADAGELPSEPDLLHERVEDLSMRICAGPLGLTCGANQYCSAAYPGVCPSREEIGVCAARPRVCTREYAPVCGCDGKTYGNACSAAAAGVAVSAPGECKGPDECASNADCADGELCAFPVGQCDTRGKCAPRPQVCTFIYQPVCGCDGRTYGNACTAAGSGVSIDYKGACRERGDFCGGIAGIPCPGEGECVDDPSDDCDPKNGGADCGGICICPQDPCLTALCPSGTQCVARDCAPSCEPVDDGCGGCPKGEYCCDPLNDRCVDVGNFCPL